MESLGLDWKLMAAQVVNFGILLFLLKKILYGPLIKAIDERNKKISDSITNSQKIEDKLMGIEEKEGVLLQKAREKAKKERDELIALADREREEIISEAKVSAQREIEKGLDSIKAAEEEAVKTLSGKFMNELVEKLNKKMESDSKKSKFPVLKKLIK